MERRVHRHPYRGRADVPEDVARGRPPLRFIRLRQSIPGTCKPDRTVSPLVYSRLHRMPYMLADRPKKHVYCLDFEASSRLRYGVLRWFAAYSEITLMWSQKNPFARLTASCG